MRSSNTWALVVGLAATAASAMGGDVGCSATKPTEIVPGALTQVQVPGNLAVIKLTVLANGAQKFCKSYQVGPGGEVELPSTLGVISGAPNTTLDISLRGYDYATLQSQSQDPQSCSQSLPVGATASQGGPGPRVLRESVVTYVDQHTLFLPMPLSFSCYDTDCSNQAGTTCKAGKCSDKNVPASSLADFNPALVDGTQDCFPANACLSAATTAVAVDPASCLYDVPSGLPSGSTGLNVRVVYARNTWAVDPGTGQYAVQAGASLEQEILNLDADEGFSIPDASKPTQFKLADGLCTLAKSALTPAVQAPSTGTATFPVVREVQVSVGCPTKQPLLPFCKNEQTGNVTGQTNPQLACGAATPLTPTASAVYVVVDDSVSMDSAFGPGGYATAINAAFVEPVFRKTYVAFRFLTHLDSECSSASTTYLTPTIDFGLPPVVQPRIAPLLLTRTPPSVPDTKDSPAALDLLAAMRSNVGAYKHVLDFASKEAGSSKNGLIQPSVMFFVNRTPTFVGAGDAGSPEGGAGDGGSTVADRTSGADCDPQSAGTVQKAIENAVSQAASSGVHTYFVVLDNHDHAPPLAFFNQIQQDLAGGSGASSPVDVLDATSSNSTIVLATVAQKVTSAITCVYDLPPGVDTTATAAFELPPNTPGVNPGGVPVPQTLPLATGCTLANRGNHSIDGWNIDNGRLVVCGNSCTNLQGAIQAVTASALQSQLGDGGADGGLPSLDGGVNIPDVPMVVTMPCPDGGTH